jgi:hypothetical protein
MERAQATDKSPSLVKIKVFFTCFHSFQGQYFQITKPEKARVSRRDQYMRPAVLSISAERVLAPIRNAVLAHAGYGVIPVSSVEAALTILHARHVCAIVIANSVPVLERRRVCSEGHNLHVPSVVLDPYDQIPDDESELHVNPLDGPEAFLEALATLMQRDHRHA